jgi:hypothetical protein
MPAPQISPLPTPPSRSQSPETFSVDADAFLGAFPDFQEEANDQADYLDALAIAVDADAITASNAAAVAAGAANYQGDYNAGTTYQIGESVSYTGRRYVAKTVNTGVTPADGANWFLINDGDVLGPVSATANGIALYDGTTGKIIKDGPAPSTLGNILVSDGTNWTSAAPSAGGPSLDAIASGSLADGSTVIVNADGTISAVGGVLINPPTVTTPVVFQTASTSLMTAIYDGSAKKFITVYCRPSVSNFGGSGVGTISEDTISFGTTVQFGPGGVSNGVSAVYDKNANKFVVLYRDSNNNSIPTAQVGTVSGTTISYGSLVVFGDLNDQNPRSVAYDEASGKIVFPYRKGSGAGGVRIGTVSGTSISFGAEVIFSGSSADEISAVYDASSQKVVIAYQGGSNFGTAIVGTVSGTSISFGTPVVFESASTNQIFAVYDENAQKIVIAYRDVGNSSFGTAIVGTVSDTSISFGTPVVFESANSEFITGTYTKLAKNVTIAYRDGGNSGFGTAIVGTVSGTSISFGTPVVFESASTSNISATYDENALRVVIAYADVGNSSRGTVSLFINANSNLTTENFIGFSDGAYTNGQTARVQIVGSVDDAQSGLTAGQSYFVQRTGPLGLTADSTSVFAGTAVAANKIIVKG